MAEAKPIVAVEDLVKTYEGVNVVDGISFTVNRGEIFGILGPNGAGKTTTLEMLEALRTIDAGTASIDGIDVSRNPKKIKQIIGIQLQSTDFYNMLTLREQLKMFASLYGTKADVGALLAKVQLTEKSKTFVEKLSGGQKQRFAIASTLVNNPRVLFLDEPTTGLDRSAAPRPADGCATADRSTSGDASLQADEPAGTPGSVPPPARGSKAAATIHLGLALPRGSSGPPAR